MSFGSFDPIVRSAAWRISLWSTLVFALGTMLIFTFLLRFVAEDIRQRSDAWLVGEISLLGEVAERTPNDALYGHVLTKYAELVRNEIPKKGRSVEESNNSIFFLKMGMNRSLKLWVGEGSGEDTFIAIKSNWVPPDRPIDLQVNGYSVPFRVVSLLLEDGSRIYLGLSERDELLTLSSFRTRFILLWLLIVLFGFTMIFATTHQPLAHVRRITNAAERIGRLNLTSRVPVTGRSDEVADLALTINKMLDRIEGVMRQLHTITDSLAHDLRSPLAGIRGNLEMALSDSSFSKLAESVRFSIEKLDRLTEYLKQSLDVAAVKADVLRLNRGDVDLSEVINSMLSLYKPSMADKRLDVAFLAEGSGLIEADAALVHRMIANILDNELSHLPPESKVTLSLEDEDDCVRLRVRDDGPGFDPGIVDHLFESRVRSRESTGHGLGLAFIKAVVRAHGGTVTASNLERGGAQLVVILPRRIEEKQVLEDAILG